VTYLLYAIFGLLPSFIWLLFYLRKDKHPEPNTMIIKVFFYGMVIGPIAVLLEFFIKWLLNPKVGMAALISQAGANQNHLFIIVVFAAPIIEECLKYAVVKFNVLKNSAFDEPLDAMLYMIIAALGFAAVENLLLVFQQPLFSFEKVITISAMRFISATFIHALSSGILGYWLAKSLHQPQKKFRLLAKGISLAIFFHACYNLLIWIVDYGSTNIFTLIPLSMIFILISLMSVAVSYNFSVLKRLHPVCKICRTHPMIGDR
jgi:RsiW-degrading membrane proteinase PrsW (M82 family)